ncbi:hypothetical protein BX070DRAFT_228760 [Coemansia spiralis]|nr:hypothetical protein BX070DRAFT_228760 [Coemansia spiralis]
MSRGNTLSVPGADTKATASQPPGASASASALRLKQGTGHRKYRLGRWQSRSMSSWNPPGNPRASIDARSMVSVDISRKPSESRRSSIMSEHSDSDASNGPLAQMLLRENDEIWNNHSYRFTFYSPATGTVRATDVQTLRTDVASGLDALIRQALDEDSDSESDYAGHTGPQLSVTAADDPLPLEQNLLHPHYAQTPRARETRGLRAAALPRLYWLDITDPTDAEIMALSRIFGLHPLTTEELLLMREQGLAQDNHKSFRNYDIICYRTSAGTLSPAEHPAESADGHTGLEKRTSFVRDIAHRLQPWDSTGKPGVESECTETAEPAARGWLARLRGSRGNSELQNNPAMHGEADEVLDEPAPFYVVVLPDGVLTLHHNSVPHVRNTVARLKLDEDLVQITPDYIAYLLLDDITDTLVPTTRLLELEVDAIDELVLILTRAEHDDVLKRIGIERRHALWLVRLLHGKAEVLRAIERRVQAKGGARRRPSAEEPGDAPDSQLLTSDEEEGELYEWARRADGGEPAQLPEVTKYLADVHDHLIALTASVHHCERILARAHGNYLARINLELTHASNTTNQLATQMTVLAGIFLPLNLVAGIFGMNVKVPGRDRDDLRDFALILAAMAAFVVVMLGLCRWRRII